MDEARVEEALAVLTGKELDTVSGQEANTIAEENEARDYGEVIARST